MSTIQGPSAIPPALRKELEAFGANITPNDTGGETVHIPGAEGVWHFDPGISVRATVHPSYADDPGAASRVHHRVGQMQAYSDRPAAAVLLMGLGERHHNVGQWSIHVSQYMQRVNGIKPVRQPWVTASHSADKFGDAARRKHNGYVRDQNSNLWAAALGHLAGEAPIEAVLDAYIEANGIGDKPVKLAAIGGPTAVVRVPVPEPVGAASQQQTPQPASSPRARGPVFILPN